MTVYRYRLLSPSTTRLNRALSVVPTVGSLDPPVFVDLSTTGSLDDLNEAMLAEGYAYDSTDPTSTTADAVGQAIVPPAQIREVAKSGKPFTSVAAAINSITDAASNKPYVVMVWPGVYTEAPFSMKSYVDVMGVGTPNDTQIKTNNNSAHFVTGATNSTLKIVRLTGPTGSGWAAVDCSQGSGGEFRLRDVIIDQGYYGLNQSTAGSYTRIEGVTFRYTGTPFNKLVYVSAASEVHAVGCNVEETTSGAVVTGYHVVGSGSFLEMFSCYMDSVGATDCVLANNGGEIRLSGGIFDNATNCIHVGSTGSGTEMYAQCITGDNNTNDIKVDTSTAIVAFEGMARRSKITVAAGANFSCMALDDTTGAGNYGIYSSGEVWAGTNQLPIVTWINDNNSTGLINGGSLSVLSGLQITVAAGSGYVNDGSGVLKKISWSSATPTLTASQNLVWIYVNNSGTVTFGNSKPNYATNILLGVANTGATTIRFLTNAYVQMDQAADRLYDYITEVIGPISLSGGTVTKVTTPSLQLAVTNGVYYAHNIEKTFTAASPATFTYWYRDGSGKWTTVGAQTSIDTAKYDDGSGTLANITASRFKRDLLFTSDENGTTKFHVVYGQTLYTTSGAAVDNPVVPDALLNDACRLAAIIVQQGATDIDTVVNQLPKLGQLGASTSGGTVTSHHALTNLTDGDDHTQYQLRTEKNAANGYAPLDGTTKVPVANLNTATATPGIVAVGAAAVGSGPKIAFEDHNHSVSVGAPVAIGTANNAGVATSVVRSDHVHDHGAQTVGTLHAVATGSVNGFMSSTDKTRFDGIPKTNFVATTNPGVGNDNTQGYAAGSTWINTSNGTEWVAISVATGAAVWKNTTASSTLLQTSFTRVAADTTSTSTSFATLLTVTITTGANPVTIVASGSVSNSSANVNMRLRVTVDGTSVGGVQLRSPAAGIGDAFSIVFKTAALTAGSHTIILQWATASGTIQCRPVTGNVDAESAGMLVTEVTV
jgi:hypothetical protein